MSLYCRLVKDIYPDKEIIPVLLWVFDLSISIISDNYINKYSPEATLT